MPAQHSEMKQPVFITLLVA